MINNYINYLNFLDEKLAKFFDKQKPFIHCKEGCSLCCKNAQFPFSLIEVTYLLTGVKTLPEEIQNTIALNIAETVEQRKQHSNKDFTYQCPFLINNKCSVYDYRGIICRTFGLLTQYENENFRVPFCCFQGLNYSNVIDLQTRKLSQEKIKQRGFPEEPLAFNVSYKYLTDPDFEKVFKFKFGDTKPLIDWFINDD